MSPYRYSAAGGVVVDGARVLVLRRPWRGEVRLPKGHIDPGETAEQAAVREVLEESGYAAVITADLGAQTVSFRRGVSRIERTERYFLMRLDGSMPGRPEHEFKPAWLLWDEALDELTFEPEREWVRRARAAADGAPG